MIHRGCALFVRCGYRISDLSSVVLVGTFGQSINKTDLKHTVLIKSIKRGTEKPFQQKQSETSLNVIIAHCSLHLNTHCQVDGIDLLRWLACLFNVLYPLMLIES